jgi:hypothetical protein
MENKLRASFTVMNVWAQGKWEDAIKYYFKLDRVVTPAMEEGLRFHKEWENEIKRTSNIPAIFGEKKLERPETELHLNTELSDWLILTGKIDLLDQPTVYEWKTGKSESDFYARTYQLPVYALLCTYNNKLVTKGEVHHYDQYTKKADMSIVWITDKMLKDALNWVETLGSEMADYFTKNDLFQKYGNYQTDENGITKFIPAIV